MQSGTSADLDTAIRILDIVISIGRYMLPITVAFALLAAAAAINSLATGNVIAAVFWFILTSLGAIFAGQLVSRRKAHKSRRKERTRQELTKVAQA